MINLLTFDLETHGLKGDYGSIYVVSVKPYGRNAVSKSRHDFDDKSDRSLVLWAKKVLESYWMWVSFYGSMFDIKFLNTRLLRYDIPEITPRLHLDLYPHLKYYTQLTSRSLNAFAKLYKLREQKLELGPHIWEEALQRPEYMKLLVKRGESDTRITEQLLDKAGHLIRNIHR